MVATVVAYVDDHAVTLSAGDSVLHACDVAGCYVPRLCSHPALPDSRLGSTLRKACGLCLVRTGDGSVIRACSTEVTDGLRISTDDAELRRLRAERLAVRLERHPHVCLSCPDREGCSRDQCVNGFPPEARCCDELGRCEFGDVVAFIDPQVLLPRRPVCVSRAAAVEARIRREPGLCVRCGRCVSICSCSSEAGQALEMRDVAEPKEDTLRASGCTFCGLCVLVCPTGALTAPSREGIKWLGARRERHCLPVPPAPPCSDERKYTIPADLSSVPPTAGVYTLYGPTGQVLCICGAPDLSKAITRALEEPTGSGATSFRFEVEPLFTQRETELLAQFAGEHGRLPGSADLDDELFGDDLD